MARKSSGKASARVQSGFVADVDEATALIRAELSTEAERSARRPVAITASRSGERLTGGGAETGGGR